MKLTITLSGFHGTGKSTYARIIAKNFNLRHISAGGLFRQIAQEKGLSVSELSRLSSKNQDIDQLIDERTKDEALQRNVILDGLLAGWMAGDVADLKIFLTAPDNMRFRRIARRERISYSQARQSTLYRERLERRRFKRVYGINIDDTSIYDLIFNTGLLTVKANIEVIEKFIYEYIKVRRGKRNGHYTNR
jgi:cytidylate kinase